MGLYVAVVALAVGFLYFRFPRLPYFPFWESKQPRTDHDLSIYLSISIYLQVDDLVPHRPL